MMFNETLSEQVFGGKKVLDKGSDDGDDLKLSRYGDFMSSGGSTGGGDAPYLSMRCGDSDDKSSSQVMGSSKMNQYDFRTQSLRQSKQNYNMPEFYSRKVFIGGLPPDIDENHIMGSFRFYGPLYVDWPHKQEFHSKHPPKGYAFLIYQEEMSVRKLVQACLIEDDKLYIYVSSVSINNKPVQVRPWRLSDSEYDFGDSGVERDERKTVFIGGVPRPMKAIELAMIMNRLYGSVCYASIDTDPEMKYPKGSGRIAFSAQESYVKALNKRFVQLQQGDVNKRVEIKPYVMDNQQCESCIGRRPNGTVAPFFCPNISCLRYYCTSCWAEAHTGPGREFHRPLVKDGNDRPRSATFRW